MAWRTTTLVDNGPPWIGSRLVQTIHPKRGDRESRIHWKRALALSFAALLVFYGFYSIAVSLTGLRGVDFLSFWAAARLGYIGAPDLAYDVAAHRSVEMTVTQGIGLMPFPYPPPFLLIVLPLGAVNYPVALSLWLAVTGAFYLWALRHVVGPPYSMANPALLPNALIGQTGFLTAGIFALGTRSASFGCGLILGALIIKPQLALLLPVALLAGRHWGSLAGAAASSVALCLLAIMAFGFATFQAFFDFLPAHADLLREARVPWSDIASVFALLRYAGVSALVALSIQLAVGLWAAIIVWRTWAADHPAKVPILAAATMLAPPYVFTYDAALLTIPLAALTGSRVLGLAWVLCLLPVASYAGLPVPNTIPIAAVIILLALTRGAHPGRQAAVGSRFGRIDAIP